MKKKLLNILQAVEGSGSFLTNQTIEAPFLGLEVDGFGAVGLPLHPIMVQALIALAMQAPYGKGMETVTDTSVRNTWEIDASQIRFTGPKWPDFIEKVLMETKEGLGIEGKTIEAHFYKMLVYEEGGFFLPHKDSEKEPGMFGTLIIGLPSTHTGGALHFSFEGKTAEVDFSQHTTGEVLPFVAFFADCQHEVKPVTSGYRVCLVFNLIQKGKGLAVSSPNYEEQQAALVALLKKHRKKETSLPSVVLLDHQYTPTNFSLEALKGQDLPRAQVFLAAAKEAGYYANVALLTYHLMGDLEGVDYSYGRGRRYYDEDEEDDFDGATMGEIHEETLHLSEWDTSILPSLGELSLNKETIITSEALNYKHIEPFDTDIEGYTGNAGMTIDYYYHFSAIVFWPRKKHVELLKKRDIQEQLNWLNYYMQQWDNPVENYPKRAKKLFEESLLDYDWAKEHRSPDLSLDGMAFYLVKTKDEKNWSKLLKSITAERFHGLSAPAWEKVILTFLNEPLSDAFVAAGEKGKHQYTLRILEVLQLLQFEKRSDIVDFCTKIAVLLPSFIQKIELWDIKPHYDWSDDKRKEERSLAFTRLLLAVALPNDATWATAASESLTQKMPADYVHKVLGKILFEPQWEGNILAKTLKEKVVEHLKKATAKKPESPKDWVREMPTSITNNLYSKFLAEIKAFMASPTEDVFKYSRNQSERNTMRSAILEYKLDLSMKTIERGRPYTLQLTKNFASFRKDLQQWEEDLALLGRF